MDWMESPPVLLEVRGRSLMRRACGTAMIMTLVVAAGLVGRMCPLALAQAPPVSINEVVDALRTGRSADALRLCGELLRADPQSYKVWTLRAMALEQSRQPKEALAAYQHALNFAPDYLPALEGAAQLNYKAQSPQAIPLLRKIILAQPENPTAHAMLGALSIASAILVQPHRTSKQRSRYSTPNPPH